MKCIAKALNEALFDLMDLHEDVLVIGEDILDPYGGAFQITKGLSTTFPDRVIGTPISEAAIVGLGIGLALKGYRPVVEIMFGDFMRLLRIN
jgi:pyruvate/2-oxoglutarate/acetoin dehydrogenase E1 component